MVEITVRQVTYEDEGQKMVGHLAQPDGPGPWPAVLLVHDGIGLEDYQRSRADDLAARGFAVLAMDYYGGEIFWGRPEAMLARVLPLLSDTERMLAIGRAALDQLLALPEVDARRLGAIGFGAGGRIVLELARAGVPFEAVAAIHPSFPKARAEDWASVHGSFLLCTGSQDPICTPDQVLAFGKALQDAGIDWRANIYGGAEHAYWAQPRGLDGALAPGTHHGEATVSGVSYHALHAARTWEAILGHLMNALGAEYASDDSSRGPSPPS